MNPILEQIRNIGLVPVIKLNDPQKAVELAMALKNGGIPVAEVTFRAAGADKAIANIAKAMPDILLGAGTVITVDQVKMAVDSGAKYIISPGFDLEIVEYCIKKNIPITPGCTNPSEISMACKLGLDVVKFFPAESAGGLKMLKALSGPFPNMKFIPTGGISPANLLEYLSFPKVIACGGSWMVPEDAVENNDWTRITKLAQEAVLGMLNISIAHIGVNSETNELSNQTASIWSSILGKDIKSGTASQFVGDIEIMNTMGRGKCGHIALSVSDVARAVTYLTSKGIKFNESTLGTGADGLPNFIYLNDEVGGFGVHLIKKK